MELAVRDGAGAVQILLDVSNVLLRRREVARLQIGAELIEGLVGGYC